MDSNVIPISEVTNNNDPKKNIIQHEIINFKRRRISEIQRDVDSSELEAKVILLDTDTALEPEPLTIEIEDEETEEAEILPLVSGNALIGFTNEDEDDADQEIHFDGTQIVAEELEEGKHPLDDLELEEGEVRGVNLGLFGKQFMNSHYNLRYQCPMCDKGFTQKGNLMRHYHTHTGAKPFVCNLCGHKFTQKSNLQKHIATHNGDKRFECGVCRKGFVQKANLIRHLRIHTGEKPFHCELCGHKFTQKGNLNKHLQLHTDSEVQCDHCESKFSSYSAKVRHETAMHSDKWQGDQDEPEELPMKQDHKCSECPAVFRTVKALNKHKKFHE